MKTKTRSLGTIIFGAAVALAMLFGLPTQAVAAEWTDPGIIKHDSVELDSGHMDLFNTISTGEDKIQLVIKEDATGSSVLREPEKVTLKVKQAAQNKNLNENPQAAAFYAPLFKAGLSNSPYILPLTQDPNLLWPGWDTMGAAPALGITNLEKATAEHDIKVEAAPKDGKILLWNNGDFGVVKSLLKSGGYALPGTIVQPSLAHQHANWAFTQPGTYKLKVTTTVKTTDSKKTLTTESHVYTFKVGDVKTTPKEKDTTTKPKSEAVNTSSLKQAVNAADKLKESDYVADSWKSFAAALATATGVLNDSKSTQSAVDAATKSLTQAQKGLVKADTPKTVADSKTAKTVVSKPVALSSDKMSTVTGSEIQFDEPAEVAGYVNREITKAPAKGKAWLASVHYKAQDAEPGEYPFDVTYTMKDGKLYVVTYTPVVTKAAEKSRESDAPGNNKQEAAKPVNNPTDTDEKKTSTNPGKSNPTVPTQTDKDSKKLAQTGTDAWVIAALALAFASAGALALVAARKSAVR